MAPQSIITLYDISSTTGHRSGSPNVWKARYALNFKGITYKTTWVEFHEIERTMRSIGVAPTGTRPDGSPHYTVPVIVDPSRPTPSGAPTVVSDSFKIAQYLDDAYPSPGLLFPPGTKALHALFRDHFSATVMMPFMPALAPYVYTILTEASHPSYRAMVESFLGEKLENVCPKGSSKWDEKWLTLQKSFSTLATLLDENGSAPDAFIMGAQPTFSDFVVAAWLETLFTIHPEEGREKIRTWDNGRWEKLRDLCAEWRSVH